MSFYKQKQTIYSALQSILYRLMAFLIGLINNVCEINAFLFLIQFFCLGEHLHTVKRTNKKAALYRAA